MWLRLVQSARDKEEQNLEAYIKNGQLFYRSLRRIAKDEELLVWYGKELTELLLLYSSRSHKMNGRLACDLRVGLSPAGKRHRGAEQQGLTQAPGTPCFSWASHRLEQVSEVSVQNTAGTEREGKHGAHLA